MKKAIEYIVLFCIYGAMYLLIEMLWRGHTHWTMFFVGGLSALLIGCINEYIEWTTPLWIQAVIGGWLITAVEFVSGLIINVWLGWNVWDYSNMPMNILGQICFPFTFLWMILSIFAIVLDDYLRYWIFKEEKPHYEFL